MPALTCTSEQHCHCCSQVVICERLGSSYTLLKSCRTKMVCGICDWHASGCHGINQGNDMRCCRQNMPTVQQNAPLMKYSTHRHSSRRWGEGMSPCGSKHSNCNVVNLVRQNVPRCWIGPLMSLCLHHRVHMATMGFFPDDSHD